MNAGLVQEKRIQQIQTLSHHFATTREVQKGNIYDIPINLTDRTVVIFHITLPKEFPLSAPRIQLLSGGQPMCHPQLDSQGFVRPEAHPNLLRWSIHTSLAKTITELSRSFQKDPPTLHQSVVPTSAVSVPNIRLLQQQQQPPMVPYSPQSLSHPQVRFNNPVTSFGATIATSSSPTSITPPPPYTHIPKQFGFPPVPTSFPELENKTTAELEELLKNEKEFSSFFEQLDSVKSLRKEVQRFHQLNAESAKRNLELEEKIKAAKKELEEKIDFLNQRTILLDSLLSRQRQFLNMYSTKELLARLGTEAARADLQSEQIANDFLERVASVRDNNSNNDEDGAASAQICKEFIKNFMKERSLYYLRSAQKENLEIHPPSFFFIH